jgi:hypothetical protein
VDTVAARFEIAGMLNASDSSSHYAISRGTGWISGMGKIQDLFINSAFAQMGYLMLWQLFRSGTITNRGCSGTWLTFGQHPCPFEAGAARKPFLDFRAAQD